MATRVTVFMGTNADGNDIGLNYSPSEVTIAAGTTVHWQNNDDMAHTATSNAGSAESFDSGTVELNGGFDHTFNTPGSFSYQCTIHGADTGTINVT
jgi:plastocyanin